MRVAPVSADLLIKLAIAGLAVGAAVWAVRRASSIGSNVAGQLWNDAVAGVDTIANGINPFNPDNVFASGVNAGVSAATGREETLGGWFYDLTHADPVASWNPPAPYAPDTWSTGAGRWNNPSAYQAPGVTGPGGAAFGIYPRP